MESFLEGLVLYGMFLFGIGSRDNLLPGPGISRIMSGKEFGCVFGGVFFV